MTTHPDSKSATTTPSGVRRLFVIAALAFLGAAVVFVLGVRTEWGQRFGDAALRGRLAADPELRAGALELLDMIRRSSMLLMGGGIIAIALVRRRWRSAIVVAAILAVSIGGAEFLKDHLHRPDLGIDPAGITENSAPSGHTTIALTLVMCALIVVPRSVRTLVAIVGSVYAALIASGTLAAGWHRPTDAVMAVCWTLAVASAGVLILTRWNGGIDAESTAAHGRDRIIMILAIALPILVLGGSFLITHRHVVWTEPSGRFFVAAAVIDVVAACSVLLFRWSLDGLALDPTTDRRSEPGAHG